MDKQHCLLRGISWLKILALNILPTHKKCRLVQIKGLCRRRVKSVSFSDFGFSDRVENIIRKFGKLISYLPQNVDEMLLPQVCYKSQCTCLIPGYEIG